MYVACSSLCFSQYSLSEALHTITELRFNKVDLALHEHGPHLKPSEVFADVNRAALLLKKSNCSFAAFHVDIGQPDGDRYREVLRSVCRLGRLLAVPVVNVQAAPIGSDLATEVTRLTTLSRIAAGEGVILTVETHGEKLTADPQVAAELCKKVPGLGLTLDPSHYLIGAVPRDHDVVYPHVKHVRLRDSAKDRLQVRVGQGQVEYGRIISQLDREGYNRALCVDIHKTGDIEGPIEPEVRKLKYLLESMVEE